MTDMSRRKSATAASPVRETPPGVLAGAIAPTMLRLAWPTVVVLVVQTLVGVAETYFVSFLGTNALAGVALVFPVLMLMQMMSNGGIGGGVSSAVARALGAGRKDDADALVWHAIVLAAVSGLVFTAAAITGGPALYRTMGGTGPVLGAALTYSTIVFAGSIPIWIVALLSAALRAARTTVPGSGEDCRRGDRAEQYRRQRHDLEQGGKTGAEPGDRHPADEGS